MVTLRKLLEQVKEINVQRSNVMSREELQKASKTILSSIKRSSLKYVPLSGQKALMNFESRK